MQQSNEKRTKNKPAKDQKKGGMDPGRQQQGNKPDDRNAAQQQHTNKNQGMDNKNKRMDDEDLSEDMGSGRRQDDN